MTTMYSLPSDLLSRLLLTGGPLGLVLYSEPVLEKRVKCLVSSVDIK